MFQSPVGTEEERNSGQIWPGTWVDATPYGTRYQYGYHTGADLNNNRPRFDADAHAPVHAIGDGKVTYAQLVSRRVWGNLIVIDHGTVDGKPLFSRYGHVEAIRVRAGEFVGMGQQISQVGNGEGLFPYHLHFDISTTAQLLRFPTYWPGNDRQGVKHHFADPKEWLLAPHEAGSLPDANAGVDSSRETPPRTPALPLWYVIPPQGVTIHKSPSASSEKLGALARGAKLFISASGAKNEGFIWGQIVGGSFGGGWVARGKADQSETYLSTNPPRN
jgi:murein DD-endopeptidase MepM/ murein hydrolase activator NlpD